MDTTKLLLLAGAGYLAYTYFGTPAATQTNTGTTAPSFTGITGTLAVGANATLTVTVKDVTGAPSFWFNGTQLNASLTGTSNVYTVTIPAALITGASGALGIQASNGKAAVTITISNPVPGGAPPPAPPPVPTVGSIHGHNYSTQANFLAALKLALNDVGGSGNQSIDGWNWFMVNQVGAAFLAGGVGPDPTFIANEAGVGRNDSLSASKYIDAANTQGFIVFPAGLAGLSALARGIQTANKHPFAGRNVRGLRKVVIQ